MPRPGGRVARSNVCARGRCCRPDPENADDDRPTDRVTGRHHPGVRFAPVLPPVDRAGRSRPPATGSASRPSSCWPPGSAARSGAGAGRHQPRDGRPHRPRLLLRAARRRAGRPVGPQAGDDRLRPRSGRGDRLPAVRAQPRPAWCWRRCCSRRLRCCGRRPRTPASPSSCRQSHLTTANSLSLAAAYGTFPFAALLFAILAGVSGWLGGRGACTCLSLDQMALAFYVDAAHLRGLRRAGEPPRHRRPPRPRRPRRATTRGGARRRPCEELPRDGTTSSSTTPCGR